MQFDDNTALGTVTAGMTLGEADPTHTELITKHEQPCHIEQKIWTTFGSALKGSCVSMYGVKMLSNTASAVLNAAASSSYYVQQVRGLE